ncbi:DnaT-like ssDNA-binding domain-containing protein [Vreelandella venusta]|uniref:DnaT-like ssDNA-binding domain-containing protein n=1 Tax=Vreelandella venusta TaxID=44935 RepID=UPI00200C454D|nr:DnaT-like ssDNA-binding domain-containing protein [Halomonas venusta]UQI41901.1 DnaT-like ssDNA-binding domain-containing protein [Halomonas venusta]
MGITAAMLPALLGRPVAYQAVFTRLPGVTVQGAIFLSQALFLTNTPTAAKRDGWFWKEQQGEHDSWESETGMSAKQQVTARKQLTQIGVLEEVRKGVPAKTWYRVNAEALAEQLALALSDEGAEKQPETPATTQTLPTGESESAQQENQESPQGSAQNPPNGVFLQRLQQRVTPSLSDAGELEPTVFERAAQQADDGEPAAADLSVPRKTAMTLEWEPEPETYAVACYQRGLDPETSVFVSAALIDFREHFAAQPGRTNTHADWTRRFVRWVAENAKRQQAALTATNGGNAHANRRSSTPKRRITAQEARAAHEGRAPEPPGQTLDGEWSSANGW